MKSHVHPGGAPSLKQAQINLGVYSHSLPKQGPGGPVSIISVKHKDLIVRQLTSSSNRFISKPLCAVNMF